MVSVAQVSSMMVLAWLAGAAAADTTLARKILQQPLTYVPSGCQGLRFSTYASIQGSAITGTVTVSNPQDHAVPLDSVIVQLSNNVPVAPIFVNAICPDSEVPYDPRPFTLGHMECTFAAQLPGNGPAAAPSVWTTAQPTATISLSGSQCSGNPTIISQSPPPTSSCPSPITISARFSADLSAIAGTVTFSNAGWASISISNPVVQISNTLNPTYGPMFGTLACDSDEVPWNPLPGRRGTLTCTFSVSLAGSDQPWTAFGTAFAKVTLPDSGEVCSSPVVAVAQPLLGASLDGSNAGADDDGAGAFSGGSLGSALSQSSP